MSELLTKLSEIFEPDSADTSYAEVLKGKRRVANSTDNSYTESNR